jgi:hypothetical protein
MQAFLALLLALAPFAQSPAPATPPSAAAAAPATPAVLARPAVLGASVSAGFGLQRDAGRPLDLAGVLAELLLVETEEPLDGSSQWLFTDPERMAREKAEALLAREPSVLFAVDFLFWFAYGVKQSEERHLERFEQGLKLLDRFPCPIVVGDVPDMSRAVDAPVKMIRADQVPEPAVIARLNARLHEWAAERPSVCVMLDTLDRAREDVTPEMVRWNAEAALAALRPPARTSEPEPAPAGGR